MSIDQLQANYPLSINWVQFPLHPETPAAGMALTELFPGRDLAPMQEHMRQLMAEAGLPYGERSHTYNSRLAQELGKWAESQDRGDPFHRALFHAYFVDGVNIADTDKLLEIAGQTGLDREQAREVLDQRQFQDAVDRDWQQARTAGITGVPTFVSNELMVVGCQPYAVLERFVKHLLELEENDKQ